MELRDYVRVVRRRWKAIIGCVVLLVAAASIITINTTPQYASTARLFVSTPNTDNIQVYEGAQFSEQRVTSYADLATGRDMASRVIRTLHLHMTPAELADKIQTEATPDTVILSVTATDSSPDRAQRLAKGYAEELPKFVAVLETPPGKHQAPIKATVVDSPELPSSPVSPSLVRNVGLGILMGLVLGLAVALVRELLDTSIKGANDVAEVTDSAVMATIAFDAAATRQPLITELDSHAPRIEAFRVLRTNMQFIDIDTNSKIFVVSSAMSGEGKTSTATNLAITLAQAGQRVLLVDGDLRRPTIAERLGLEPTVGLTSLLVGRVERADAFQRPAAIPELTVLTSGTLPPNPSELLQSRAMTELATKLRAEFDVIVIDTPPLLPVADAALLATISDGALLVARHGKTTRDQLSDSIGRLVAVGAKPLGVVLNMVPRQRTDFYGYGYSRRHGHSEVTGREVSTAEFDSEAVMNRTVSQ